MQEATHVVTPTPRKELNRDCINPRLKLIQSLLFTFC